MCKGQTVFVARYEHRHGVDYRVFADEQSANRWRYELATAWWSHEMPDDEAPPEDLEERATAYFERVSGREYFEIDSTKVE
jgi:hypothetical protein